MSLINEVLKDLESRQSHSPSSMPPAGAVAFGNAATFVTTYPKGRFAALGVIILLAAIAVILFSETAAKPDLESAVTKLQALAVGPVTLSANHPVVFDAVEKQQALAVKARQ